MARAVYTEDQIRKVCQLLQDHPEITYREVENITGMSFNAIAHIYGRRSWKQISKDYDFPPRQSGIPIYTEDQIRKVCELLVEHPDWEYSKISDQTGVSKDSVSAIYRRNHWTNISRDYKFPKRTTPKSENGHKSKKYTEDQIRDVCELLNAVYLKKRLKLSYKQIGLLTGVNEHTVAYVATGRNWRHVSKDYDFSETFLNL